MKRRCRAILVLALLLLGAAANLGVAWGIAASHVGEWGYVAFGPSQRQYDSPDWITAVPDHWPDSPQEGEVMSGYGWNQVVQARWDVEGVALLAVRFEAGFPARCVWRATLEEDPRDASGRIIRRIVVDQVGHTAMLGIGCAVPTKVLAPGFLANTLFYAAILALPLMFFQLRRRLRARRGRCPRCNYDLAGLEKCPECGSAQ